MAVGPVVFRVLEARRLHRPYCVFGDRYNRRFHVAVFSLSRQKTLGGRCDGSGCSGCGTILGRPTSNVHLYPGKLASLAARARRIPSKTAALDTAPVPALD